MKCLAVFILLLIFIQVYTQLTENNFLLQGFQPEESIRSDKSKNIAHHIKPFANPCDDFYEFTCGNWQASEKRANSSIQSPHSQMAWHVDRALMNILDEPVSLEDGNSGYKIKEFYKSCIAAEKNSAEQHIFFSEIIKAHGGFPAVPGSNWYALHYHDYKWQHIVAELRHHYGLNILIGIDIDINQLSEDENSLYFVEPDTIIPNVLCSNDATKRLNSKSLEYLALKSQVIDNLILWLTLKSQVAQQVADEIVTFEYHLCSGMRNEKDFLVQYQNFYPYTKRKTLGDLTNQFNHSIDFNEFTTTSFGTTLHRPVFMSAPGYYQHLIDIMQQYNKTVIANYIMYRALSTLSFPHNRNEQINHCLASIKRHFPQIIGHMYQRKYADIVKRDTVDVIFTQLKSTLQQSLRNSKWLEEGAKRATLDLLSKLKLSFPNYDNINHVEIKIEHKNYWHNLAQVLAQVHIENLQKLNVVGTPEPKQPIEAYDIQVIYRRVHKRIDIGWGLLQTPHYQHSYPKSVHYATIGYKLARALVTAFDDVNWSTNTMSHYFWDPLTARTYALRTECFREQISNYFYENPNKFTNITYVREYVASSSALNIAFKAYIEWLHYLSPNNDFPTLLQETFPTLNFSNTQLFFISFAQSFCQKLENTTKNNILIVSPLQRHTEDRLRVNGPLTNFIEFAREFDCSAGIQMNVINKCVFYA